MERPITEGVPPNGTTGNLKPGRIRTLASAQVSNGVIYCRVSSKEQVQGTSLESQEIACKEYARIHGIAILRIFVERGESAKVADRTQLIELIDFCRNSKTRIDALIVWKLDRFARNVGDHFNIKATLLKYGVRVVSVTEPIDANPEGKLMEAILAGFAQFDNDIRATRTVQGMKRKIQEGIAPWKPPLGYKSAERNGVKKTRPDEPDEPVFGLLRKAWTEFATGAYTKAEMIRRMESWGIQTANGISMTAQSLDNLFRNSYYAGILVDPWTRKEYRGHHVPMVDGEIFSKVQVIVTGRNRSIPHKKERDEFPVRGFARCPSCKHPLTGGFSRGRSHRYAYYTCCNRSCDSRSSTRAELVHDEFGALLDRIAPEREFVTALKWRVLEVAKKMQSYSLSNKKSKDAELLRLRKEVEQLIRMRAQNLITDDEFVAMRATAARRQHAVNSREASWAFDARRIQSDLKEITLPLSRLRATWRAIPVGFQARFNRMVVPVGFVVSETRTAELGDFFKLSGALDGKNSHEVALTGENLNRLSQAIRAFAELFRDLGDQKLAA